MGEIAQHPDTGTGALVDKFHHKNRYLIVLKGGAFETMTRAAEARAAVPGVEVFGGLVMNWPSGGINPAAVQAMR